jgi:hypothetical protein
MGWGGNNFSRTAVAAAARCERHNDGTRRRTTRNEVSEERGSSLRRRGGPSLCCYRFTAGVPEAAFIISSFLTVGIMQRSTTHHNRRGEPRHDPPKNKEHSNI